LFLLASVLGFLWPLGVLRCWLCLSFLSSWLWFQVMVLWVVTPCSDVVGYQRFGKPRCIHLQGSYRLLESHGQKTSALFLLAFRHSFRISWRSLLRKMSSQNFCTVAHRRQPT
jgi:hypothetical protein